jgi:hypothetical protein
VRYYKRSFLAGRSYQNAMLDLHAADRDALQWVEQVAGMRPAGTFGIHGTTRQRPLERFQTLEREALQPLPAAPYEPVTWKRGTLHRDGHITFGGAYYSAPCALVGETLWVRATAERVELWHNHTRVALHTRASARGVFVTEKAHLPAHKQAAFDALHGRGQPHAVSRQRAADIGPFTQLCVEHLLANPFHNRRRTAERLIALADRHSKAVLERACRRAVESGDLTSGTIRTLLKLCLSGALPEDAPPETVGRSGQPAPQSAPRFARSADELIPIVGNPSGNPHSLDGASTP